MKTNAIVRVVIYSLVILLLIGMLLMGLGVGTYIFTFRSGSGQHINGEKMSIPADQVSDLHIEWAAGSILIQTADTDQITFSESGNFSEDYAMVYTLKGDTLKLEYSNAAVQIGFVSTPSKDLVITVPQNWTCEELELDGAALEVEINGLTIKGFDIDGASNEIDFTGSLEILECDGAACELTLNCQTKPWKIDLDGASIQMELLLPEDCGFQVQMDGLSCSFRSDLECTSSNGDYAYGDRYCQINASGLSCAVTVNHAPVSIEVE